MPCDCLRFQLRHDGSHIHFNVHSTEKHRTGLGLRNFKLFDPHFEVEEKMKNKFL